MTAGLRMLRIESPGCGMCGPSTSTAGVPSPGASATSSGSSETSTVLAVISPSSSDGGHVADDDGPVVQGQRVRARRVRRAGRRRRVRCPARGPADPGGSRGRRESRDGPGPPGPAASRVPGPARTSPAKRRSDGLGVRGHGVADRDRVRPDRATQRGAARGEEQRRELADRPAGWPPAGTGRAGRPSRPRPAGAPPGSAARTRPARRRPRVIPPPCTMIAEGSRSTSRSSSRVSSTAATLAGFGPSGSRSSTVTSTGTPSASYASWTAIGSQPVAMVTARMRPTDSNARATGARRTTSGRLPATSRMSWS